MECGQMDVMGLLIVEIAHQAPLVLILDTVKQTAPQAVQEKNVDLMDVEGLVEVVLEERHVIPQDDVSHRVPQAVQEKNVDLMDVEGLVEVVSHLILVREEYVLVSLRGQKLRCQMEHIKTSKILKWARLFEGQKTISIKY